LSRRSKGPSYFLTKRRGGKKRPDGDTEIKKEKKVGETTHLIGGISRNRKGKEASSSGKKAREILFFELRFKKNKKEVLSHP